MLSAEKNRLLTEVGPGTKAGALLRRYWMPIAAQAELDDRPIKPVRLLGEDLVLYKDLGGAYGLLGRHCPHRRADLAHGFVEDCGLRCSYHGWRYGTDGQCLEQPFDDTAYPERDLKRRIRATAYPVEAKGGLLWAYLGPAPAPLLPDWEFFSWPNGFVQIVTADVPCNWFQCQENSIDPVHFEWTHANWSVRLKGDNGPYAPTHVRLDFTEFEHGFQYKRVTAVTDESHKLWTIGRVCLWPNALFTGDHIEFRVPVDDENTLSITWSFNRVPRAREPYVQNRIPYWHGPVKDASGNWITSHVMNQDFVAWAGQGAIADRTKENLGGSDLGIALMRKRFFEEIDVVAAGGEPWGVIRDAAKNRRIELPVAERGFLIGGDAAAMVMGGRRTAYVFQAGQPDAVRREFEEVMGV